MTTQLTKRGSAGAGSTLWSALAAVAVLVSGCGGGEDTSDRREAAANINSPAQIAQASADDYNANEYGLITGETLSRWIGDWENERPAAVTGRLIVLQLGTGPASAEYVRSDAPNVYTYAFNTNEISMDRNNGVIITPTLVADGATMDVFLKKYAINPSKDMVVCARASGSILNQGRCWYTLRYWGMAAHNLAFLDGDYSWQVDAGNPHPIQLTRFAAAPATAPNNGKHTVRDMPQDNFALIATIQDMMAITTPGPQNNLADGVMVWDARGLNQYAAGEAHELGQSGCADPYCGPVADYMTTFQNNATRQGHPHGTLQLQFTRMTVASEGSRFKSKAELQAYMNGETDADGMGFVDYTYQPVGAGNAYQPGDTMYVYCETTQRAQVTGFVTAAILGLPTRYYDGAMIEWNSLSNIVTKDGTPVLPIDSPWRTDLETLSFFRQANDTAGINQRDIVDAYASSTNAHVEEDRRYSYGLDDPSSGGGGGGGGTVAPPANPCGG